MLSRRHHLRTLASSQSKARCPHRQLLDDIHISRACQPVDMWKNNPRESNLTALLAMVIDCATRKIVGWAMDDNYKTPLITRAIRMAARNVNLPDDAIFHSDYAEVGVKP